MVLMGQLRHICQYVIIAMLVVGFLYDLWVSYEGQKEREPGGFGYGMATIALYLAIVAVLWIAGAFSALP